MLMSERILSQEEIDALLSAMSKGEVDLDARQVDAPDVQAYDLGNKSKMLQEQFYALEEVNDKLTNKLKSLIQGQKVVVDTVARDTYGRAVANVKVGGKSVNKAMSKRSKK